MQLEILTPDRTIFSGNITSVTLPGTKSPFAVLKNHAPMISTLEKGELSLVTSDGLDILYIINEGILEVNQNKIMVLSESIRQVEL